MVNSADYEFLTCREEDFRLAEAINWSYRKGWALNHDLDQLFGNNPVNTVNRGEWAELFWQFPDSFSETGHCICWLHRAGDTANESRFIRRANEKRHTGEITWTYRGRQINKTAICRYLKWLLYHENMWQFEVKSQDFGGRVVIKYLNWRQTTKRLQWMVGKHGQDV